MAPRAHCGCQRAVRTSTRCKPQVSVPTGAGHLLLPSGVGAAESAPAGSCVGEFGSLLVGTGMTGAVAAVVEGMTDLRFSLSANAVCARSIRCRNSADGSSSNRLKRRREVEGRQQQKQRSSSDGRPWRALGWAGTRSAGASDEDMDSERGKSATVDLFL